MNYKINVIQTFFDKGFINPFGNFSTKKNNHKIIKMCISSVQDWCLTNGFDYELVAKKPDIEIDTRFLASDRHYSCYQYACFPSSGYDYIVYSDNDVWIVDPSTELPLFDLAASSAALTQSTHPYYQYYISPAAISWESSILVLSQNRANHLREWILPRISGEVYTPGWSEQLDKIEFLSLKNNMVSHVFLLSLYCFENGVECLPKDWNIRPHFTYDDSIIQNAKVIHFQTAKKIENFERLTFDQKKKFSQLPEATITL